MKGKIEVVGLGAGDVNQLPLGIYKQLTSSRTTIVTRTMDHPVIQSLQSEGIKFESYDEFYKQEDQFGDVYKRIVRDLLEKASNHSIIYAVPGHPMLAEKTVQLLRSQTDIVVEVSGGQSYLDALFTSLNIDPIEGFQFVDATGFNRRELNYRHHLIFCQVYDRFVASEVKLSLLEDLPYDYEVIIIEAAGSETEVVRKVPLEELDYDMEISNLTSVYVPPASDDVLNHTFLHLKEVIETLRGPKGCAWDKAQTHETLREYIIEETYELIDAINAQDDEGMIEELGDVLLQVLLHSQIGEDNGYFTIDDVIQTLTVKMIHRHPHVFKEKEVDSLNEITKNWDELKQEEKGDTRHSVLDGIPSYLPALLKANKIQKKAAKVGFDWDDVNDIWDKINEEITEVKEALHQGDTEEITKEFGDVLFALVNLLRFYDVNPEMALESTNRKFKERFTHIEQELRKRDKDIRHSTVEEMDYYWDEAKGKE